MATRQVQRNISSSKTAVSRPEQVAPVTLSHATTTPTVTIQTKRDRIQRAIAAAERPSEKEEVKQSPQKSEQTTDTNTTPPLMTFTAPQAIQRSTEFDDSSISEPSNTEFEDEIEDDVQPDIDELARQVYAQLKRRLKIEWERGRGRY